MTLKAHRVSGLIVKETHHPKQAAHTHKHTYCTVAVASG